MIINHYKQWKFLKNALQERRASHFYLFSGPESVGKKTFAFDLVGFKKNHPDFFLVEPELGKKDIQISQIRGLVYRLSLKPFVADYKIAIIDQAHLMNTQAQNCLLKTLEEPKGNTILFLITEHPEVLLETIRSRAQEIKFYPLSNKEIEKFLLEQGLPRPKAREIAFWSLGRPGKALEFLKEPEKLLKEKKQARDFSRILKKDLAARFQYAKSISDKSLKQIFEIWLKYLRQTLIKKIKISAPIKVSIFDDFSLEQIKKAIKQIEKTNFLISTKNINKRLALETLMLNINGLSRDY